MAVRFLDAAKQQLGQDGIDFSYRMLPKGY
jgi:hypothetical protein